MHTLGTTQYSGELLIINICCFFIASNVWLELTEPIDSDGTKVSKSCMKINRNYSFRKEPSALLKVVTVWTGRQAKHMVVRLRAKEFTPMCSGLMKRWEVARTGEWRKARKLSTA